MKLRFGIIGMSPGNGHPYSWSAIFNGYDSDAMSTCPFPTIPIYLANQSFPDDGIGEASVTHIWTEERIVSENIAAAAYIPHVVDNLGDMIGAVDGILLARDDAERHFEFAAPFLDASLPVYIDKPLALSVEEAKRLYARERRRGQIFTCSALAFAREFQPTTTEMLRIGRLRFVEAVTPKDWDRYAIHVLEPLSNLLVNDGPIVRLSAGGTRSRHLDATWESGVEARVTALGDAHGPIALRLYGDAGWQELVFKDSFAAFRAALRRFTDIVLGRVLPQDPRPVLDLVRLIQAGRTIT